MRVVLHSELVAGASAPYELEHGRIPNELREVFDRAGIVDWTIWRSGDRLFHLVECDDFDSAMTIIRDDPADARWQSHIGRFVQAFYDSEGEIGYAPLRVVWSLAEQRSADPE
ncbi:L-rhamnose mutarotase [Microbacterium sp. F51-2R]|uniref:L-rhamnose mutarotase n=1 Tax=Microbacterium sp. F51-2R TaxID=3445777 RepID=UPI003FA06461